MADRVLRYLGYIFIWPLLTSVTYMMLGAGTNLFVFGAVLSLPLFGGWAIWLLTKEDLHGLLWLLAGWAGTAVSVMVATLPRFVTPFALPEMLVLILFWPSLLAFLAIATKRVYEWCLPVVGFLRMHFE